MRAGFDEFEAEAIHTSYSSLFFLWVEMREVVLEVELVQFGVSD